MWALCLLTRSLLAVSVMAQSKPNEAKPHDEYLGSIEAKGAAKQQDERSKPNEAKPHDEYLGIIGAKWQDECVKHLATDFLSERAIAEIFKGLFLQVASPA